MKKFSAKLVVSALVAAAMASMTAVSVFADYHSGYSSGTTTPTTTTTTTTETKTETVAAGVVTEENVKSAIEDAVKAGKTDVTVKVAEDTTTGKVTVQEAVIADIAKAGVPVTFEVTPADGIAYSVTIDPASIKEAKAIDIGMKIATGSQLAAMAASLDLDVEVNKNAVIVMPVTQGQFGMDLAITFPASEIGTLSSDNAYLFYISDDGNVSDVTDQLTFDAKGNATITISHASAYFITDVDIIALADQYADDADDDEDADEDDDFDADVDDDVIDDGAVDGASDNNPTTGVGIALGALAVSAAAVAVTAKKRK